MAYLEYTDAAAVTDTDAAAAADALDDADGRASALDDETDGKKWRITVSFIFPPRRSR